MSTLDRRTAIVVFLAFAFAYFFSALLRSITATLAPTLTRELALHARDLGLLAGGYFIGFAATQLPLGTWLDRHGPKKVILGFLALAVVGCLAFSVATSFSGLLAARVLCGVGVSACMMAPLTGFRRWLLPTAQLRANSWMLMTGSFGMLASTLPVQWLMPVMGWRPLFWGLAGAVAASMAVIAWKVPAWQVAPAPPGGRPGSYARGLEAPLFPPGDADRLLQFRRDDLHPDPVGRAVDGPGGGLRAAGGGHRPVRHQHLDALHLPGLGDGHALARPARA